MNEVNSERSETNDYHKRKDIAKKQREIYIFNGIKKAKHMLSTETINKYIERFPYEKAERTAKGLLKQIGIKVASRQYQMCLEDVDIAYLYTIYRCAYCGYEHIECYFKRMMRIASVWSFYLDNEERDICMENNLRLVNVDGDNAWSV